MPVLIFALAIVLFLGALFTITYFLGIVALKLLKIISQDWSVSSLPYTVKRSLREARDYAQKIRRTARQCPPGPMRDRLDRTIKPVDEWLVNLNRLEQALTKLYMQHNINRDLRRVTSEIEQLRRQRLETNKNEITYIRALADSKKKQRAALEELQAFQNQAELKIRRIASDLGTVHTEMLLVIAKGDFNENRFQRLDENLQDNLSGLRDMVAAMDEMGYTSTAGY